MTKAAKTSKAAKKGNAEERPDRRKALLLYLDPEVTLDLKKAALDASKPAYILAEEAIKDFLKRTKK